MYNVSQPYTPPYLTCNCTIHQKRYKEPQGIYQTTKNHIIAFRKSNTLLSGTVPSQLKIAHVTPTFKAGDKYDFSNYRPISVLPTLGKLVEKVVYVCIFDFISKYNTLVPQQVDLDLKDQHLWLSINFIVRLLKILITNCT